MEWDPNYCSIIGNTYCMFTLLFHVNMAAREDTVMAAIKHWFAELSNSKVRIFVDNQACVALLNYGITRSPFLATCLREIYFVT